MYPKINIIVPLYNEEEVFNTLISRLDKIINDSGFTIEVILIDDGSIDETPLLMENLSLKNPNYQALFLSRNFGHPIALSAGLNFSNATEGVFIIDGDLQDPPELLFDFYEYLKKGYDVIYGIRKNRKEGIIKRFSYHIFYLILRKIAKIEIPIDSGDFSLISIRVVNHLNSMPEESRFIRGMRSWIGFSQIGVEYNRECRALGKSKYSFSRLLQLALNGIFNFSEYPIRFIIIIGLSTVIVSIIYFVYTLFLRIFYNVVPQGFTALLFMIILFGGIQLLSIGIIGNYIIRIFFQVKNRPLYILKERIIHSKKTIE
jgi:polyisoprenyl-phosphate glycosyltransferase